MRGCCCNVWDKFASTQELDRKTLELAAISASVAANCMPCLQYHFAAARKAKCTKPEIQSAIQIASFIKRQPDSEMEELAATLLKRLKR